MVSIHTSPILLETIRKGKANDWYRAKEPADMSVSYVALMTSMAMGGIIWDDNKVTDKYSADVVVAGVPKHPRPGYSPYSSILLVDNQGLVCTYTSSSWGGWNALKDLIPHYKLRWKQAFPIVQVSSKPRGDNFGTIDPVFRITGWVPAEKFTAITGETSEPKAIAPPSPGPPRTAKPKKAGKIDVEKLLDDEVPF